MICVRCVLLLLVMGGVNTQRRRGESGSSYNYDPKGPTGVFQWSRNYITCSGERQSPVNIDTNNVRYVQHQCPHIRYQSRVQTGKLTNTGLFAKFTPNVPGAVSMTNVPYNNGDMYVLKGLHAHHGGILNRGDTKRKPSTSILYSGAEHLVNGHRYDGEVHMVFYNRKFKDLKEASQYRDGLAVIAVFVEVVPDNLLKDQRFSIFLEKNLPRVTTMKSQAVTEVDIGMFLDRECSFYTYDGSLTTPYCNESVQWMVLRQPMQVGKSAWVHYGAIESHGNHNEVYGNYRNTMPINNRVVTANFIPGNPQSYVTRRLLTPAPARNMAAMSARTTVAMSQTSLRQGSPTKTYIAPFGFHPLQRQQTVAPQNKLVTRLTNRPNSLSRRANQQRLFTNAPRLHPSKQLTQLTRRPLPPRALAKHSPTALRNNRMQSSASFTRSPSTTKTRERGTPLRSQTHIQPIANKRLSNRQPIRNEPVDTRRHVKLAQGLKTRPVRQHGARTSVDMARRPSSQKQRVESRHRPPPPRRKSKLEKSSAAQRRPSNRHQPSHDARLAEGVYPPTSGKRMMQHGRLPLPSQGMIFGQPLVPGGRLLTDEEIAELSELHS